MRAPRQGAVDDVRHLGDGEVVDVAQRKGGAVLRREPLECVLGTHGVEAFVPWVEGLGSVAGDGAESTLLPRRAPPVVGQLVAGDTNQPRGRECRRAAAANCVHGGEECLSGEVLGQRRRAAAGQEIAVYNRERAVIQGEKCCSGLIRGRRHAAHIMGVVRDATTPTVPRGDGAARAPLGPRMDDRPRPRGGE